MSNETKQTAIYLFSEKTFNLIGLLKNGYVSQEEFLNCILTARDEAKKIEQEQMMQCYSDGLGNGMAVGKGECSYQSVADEKEYLIKKYGGNK